MAIILIAMAVPGSAQTVVDVAATITETATVPAGEWKAYRIELGGGYDLRFNVQVSTLESVDVYTMSATGYSEYVNPSASSFPYYVAGTRENTRAFSGSFSAPSAGTYYFVVDNAPISMSGAAGITPATVTVTLERTTFPLWLVGLGVLVVIAVIVAIALYLRARRKKQRAAMPPPMYPPQPPMQPPMSPPQEPPVPPPPGP